MLKGEMDVNMFSLGSQVQNAGCGSAQNDEG